MIGTIFDIKKYAVHDGPGIRTTVFFQGCPLSCWWCHNPESQSARPVLLYRQNRCMACGACIECCPHHGIQTVAVSDEGAEPVEPGVRIVTDYESCNACGACAEACYFGAREISGAEMKLTRVLTEIERDIPFYDQTGGGVTFSGGEPFGQFHFLVALLEACKERAVHTAVDTSGYAPWDRIAGTLDLVDLYLYDLKLMDAELHQKYTGVSNQLILENLQRLSSAGAQIEVRVPLIPGINDDPANLEACAVFIAGLSRVPGIVLIGYHEIAAAKYAALGMAYELAGTCEPGREALEAAAEFFQIQGLHVRIE